MKRHLKLLSGLILSSFIFFMMGCNKEEITKSENKTDITSEINKVETIYTEGCDKIETMYKEGCSKVETKAPDYIIEENIASFKKKVEAKRNRKSRNSYENYVGVIQNGSCAGYDFIELFIDAEDHNCSTHFISNPRESSYAGHWHGSNSIDNNSKNVHLRFCLVPKSFFQKYRYKDYAVLNIGGSTPFGAEEVFSRIDAEDHNCISRFKLNDISKGWAGHAYGDLNPTEIDSKGNMYLGFWFFEHNGTGMTSFHNFTNMTYGVFGNLYPGEYNRTGGIWIDAEDNNSNSYVVPSPPLQEGDVNNVVDELGGNIALYWSKVKNTNPNPTPNPHLKPKPLH